MSFLCFLTATGRLRGHETPVRQFIKLDLDALGGSKIKALALGGATALAMVVVSFIMQKPGQATSTTAALKELIAAGLPTALLAFLCVVMAGVAEEIVSRGLLMMAIVRQAGLRRWRWAERPLALKAAAVLASAFAFAAFHGSLALMPKFFTLGLVLALAYLAWRTLWVPIIAHVLHNIIAFVIMIQSVP